MFGPYSFKPFPIIVPNVFTLHHLYRFFWQFVANTNHPSVFEITNGSGPIEIFLEDSPQLRHVTTPPPFQRSSEPCSKIFAPFYPTLRLSESLSCGIGGLTDSVFQACTLWKCLSQCLPACASPQCPLMSSAAELHQFRGTDQLPPAEATSNDPTV